MGSASAHSESMAELVNMIYMQTGAASTSSLLHTALIRRMDMHP